MILPSRRFWMKTASTAESGRQTDCIMHGCLEELLRPCTPLEGGQCRGTMREKMDDLEAGAGGIHSEGPVDKVYGITKNTTVHVSSESVAGDEPLTKRDSKT